MNLSNQELLALQNRIEKVGTDAFIAEEFRLRGVRVRKRQKIKDFTDEKAKESYIEDRKKEDEVRAELRSLMWAAYKTKNIAHLGEGIFWDDGIGLDFFDPYERYYLDKGRPKGRLIDNDLPVLESLEELIDALSAAVPELDAPMLRWFCYHRSVAETIHYRAFSIPKKSGGRRHIWAPMPKLKAMQSWILDNITARMPIHEAAHGFAHGRSILSNASVHTNSQVVLSMDLKNFFPTLTFPRVKGLFRAIGYREGIATLLSLICTEAPRRPICIQDPQTGEDKWVYVAVGPRCLPQGSPASPSLTNLACVRLDRRLTGFCQKYGLRYTRYADDLTFSVPVGAIKKHDMKWVEGVVRSIVESEGFAVHPDKVVIMGEGNSQRVTGLVVNGPDAPRVPREFKQWLRAAIHNQQNDQPFHEGENWHTLMGYASFVFSAEQDRGRRYLDALLSLKTDLGITDEE
ncbi:MAG: reverse transcriptase family protein [Myxococcota bacterium]|nr:reverse transcriptase family protein [Myxococcota bacterium]